MGGADKSIGSTEKERNDWLHRLWVAHTKKLIEKIENTPADELDAATLNQSRQLLSDNGINSDSLKQQSGEIPQWRRAGARYPSADELDEFAHDDQTPALPAPEWPDPAMK